MNLKAETPSGFRGDFLLTVTLALAFALYPFPGRWKLLQQIVPISLVFLFYRRNGYSRTEAAVERPQEGWVNCFLRSIAVAVPLYFIGAFVYGRIAGFFFAGGKDLSLFADMRGSLGTLVVYLIFMWLLAAFGEEFLWRGFLLRELGERASKKADRFAAWSLALLFSATLFGLAHAYQGGYGVIEKFLGALEFGAIYLLGGRSNIWLVVFVHGIQNTISFVAIYLGVYEQLNFMAP